jgi:antitoxin ParD1/3/4
MPDIQKVSVALTREQIDVLKAAIKDGEYATAGEIVREALRDWQLKRQLRQENLKRLQELWDAGVASGTAKPLDFDELRRMARERLNAIKKASADAG